MPSLIKAETNKENGDDYCIKHKLMHDGCSFNQNNYGKKTVQYKCINNCGKHLEQIQNKNKSGTDKLSTLAYLIALSLDLDLSLYLIPPQISIYPPFPVPYIFDLNLDPIPVPIPGLDRHQISYHPLFHPLLGFSDGPVFLPGASIIPDRLQV